MRRSILSFVIVSALSGCAESKSAGGSDAGTDAGNLCGNQIRDENEACDDGNTDDDDACRNDCTFGPICGDLVVASPEECDDGNNTSGDGCSGNCLTEGCGNMRLDPGEVCDGTPSCNGTCDAVTTCGNGTIDVGEQCDDGDAIAWDGCSAACEREQSVVLSDLDLVRDDSFFLDDRCDLNGDGFGDSSLGIALELAWAQARMYVVDALHDSPFNTLVLQGLADPSLTADDPNLRVAWVRGIDENGGGPDFDGTGTVSVDPASLSNGMSILSFPGSIANRVLDAGPEDVRIPFFGGLELGLRRTRIVTTPITVTGAPPNTSLSVGDLEGLLCGSIEIGPLGAIPNVVGAFDLPGVPTESCDPVNVPTDDVNLADVIVGGVKLQNFLDVVVATQPDVDMDGDGLETYVLVGGTDCQPVIVGCVDGDGTEIDGRDCVLDVRMRDTISAAFYFTAPTTTLVP